MKFSHLILAELNFIFLLTKIVQNFIKIKYDINYFTQKVVSYRQSRWESEPHSVGLIKENKMRTRVPMQKIKLERCFKLSFIIILIKIWFDCNEVSLYLNRLI